MSNKDKPLHVTKLTIRNILGIEHAEVVPGKVTLIQGANGQGKTSILESFRAVMKGGHDATLLRKGAESGEIVMLLDNDVTFTKTITEDSTDVVIKDADGVRIAKPATVLDRLRDAFALNPVDFLTAKKETRLALFLGALPMQVTKADLEGVLDLCENEPNLDAHALQVLNGIEKDLYDQRTGVNRVAKEKRTGAEQMKAALSPDAAGAIQPDDLARARKNRDDFTIECQRRKTAIDLDANTKKVDARKEYDAALLAITAKLTADNAAISALRDSQIDEVNDEAQEIGGELERAVATLEARMQSYTAAETTRKHIKAMLDDADRFDAKSAAFSAAIVDLDAIRERLLDKLPIKGVTVKDGEIYVDNVVFDRVNESRRVRLVVDVAMLRAGRLPVVCVDGIERLDSQSFDAMRDLFIERGIQAVLAQRTEGPLTMSNIA